MKRASDDASRFGVRDVPSGPSISVVIPAFNEARYLPQTIEHLRAAESLFRSRTHAAVEILVVNNNSTDRTAAVASELGAIVIDETDHNVGKVRNTGARAAHHELLVFLDADVLVPAETLFRIADCMRDATCVGGAIDAVYAPRRIVVRSYLAVWRTIGRLAGMAMGACQFCRRDLFDALGGYDETLFMGEDVDFVWRLGHLGRRRGRNTCFVRDFQVVPSSRRFDSWSVWRILLLTNPLLILALRRRRAIWRGWYGDSAPR
jgi:glycosyltransferase involved in cell wall biosynthesis